MRQECLGRGSMSLVKVLEFCSSDVGAEGITRQLFCRRGVSLPGLMV